MARADQLIETTPPSTLVVAINADHAALSLLRDYGRSYYVESTRETFVAPDVDDSSPPTLRANREEAPRNPFATRASRIPRLLLHPQKAFTVQELSRLASVDKSVASRTVSALATDGHVLVEPGEDDERFRYVRLADARRLLNEWGDVRRRKRRKLPQRLDIGIQTVGETLDAISHSADGAPPFVVSGLAGAQFVRNAVEPADVLLLTGREGAGWWKGRLLARPAEGSFGLLRIGVIDDDFVLSLAEPHQKLPIADPVQLWLDTAQSGERARAASDAIADAMGW